MKSLDKLEKEAEEFEGSILMADTQLGNKHVYEHIVNGQMLTRFTADSQNELTKAMIALKPFQKDKGDK